MTQLQIPDFSVICLSSIFLNSASILSRYLSLLQLHPWRLLPLYLYPKRPSLFSLTSPANFSSILQSAAQVPSLLGGLSWLYRPRTRSGASIWITYNTISTVIITTLQLYCIYLFISQPSAVDNGSVKTRVCCSQQLLCSCVTLGMFLSSLCLHSLYLEGRISPVEFCCQD